LNEERFLQFAGRKPGLEGAELAILFLPRGAYSLKTCSLG